MRVCLVLPVPALPANPVPGKVFRIDSIDPPSWLDPLPSSAAKELPNVRGARKMSPRLDQEGACILRRLTCVALLLGNVCAWTSLFSFSPPVDNRIMCARRHLWCHLDTLGLCGEKDDTRAPRLIGLGGVRITTGKRLPVDTEVCLEDGRIRCRQACCSKFQFALGTPNDAWVVPCH